MTITVRDRPAEPIPRRFDVAELDRMLTAGIIAPDERVELIDGELISMAAAKFPHISIHMALGAELIRQLDPDIFVLTAGSLRLGPRSLVEPDIMLARKAALSTSPEGFLEVPAADVLLLVEVADSTLGFDLRRKAALYARHGIAEYWVIQAKDRITHVHRGPGPDGYASVAAFGPDETLQASHPLLRAVSVRLGAIA